MNSNKLLLLHLSDSHFSMKSDYDMQKILKTLLKDMKEFIEKNKCTLDIIAFTGDLVFSGKSEELFRAIEKFIEPLLKELELKETQFLYIPGNHEVNIDVVDKDFNKSFTARIIKDGVEGEKFNKSNITERLKNFYEAISLFYKWEDGNLVLTQEKDINGQKCGFSLINTAWNSSGDSSDEAKKILLPKKLLSKRFDEIENCDYKIALMHHPIDWFDDNNASLIELLLSKYDLVLTGHKHHGSQKAIQHMNNATVFNYASKLSLTGENGYSAILIDFNNNKITITSRTYNEKREEYAPNTDICDDGICTFDIKNRNSDLQIISDVISNSKTNFNTKVNSLFITNILDEHADKKFDDIFVMPTITSKSKSKKELDGDLDSEITVNLDDEIDSEKNLFFLGKKEIGKTILAHYITKYYYNNYSNKKKIPIIINYKNNLKDKRNIINEIQIILNDLCNEYSINKKQVEDLLLKGNFTVIFDDYNFEKRDYIDKFIQQYEKCRFIFFMDENSYVFTDENKESIIEDEDNFYNTKRLSIKAMDKSSIRKLAHNIAPIDKKNEDTFLNEIITSFSRSNLPRTPFVVSLILAICSDSKDYIPTNQAKIVEQFMERLLEKLNISEIYSKTYGFDNKETFLATLAFEMHKEGDYCMPKSDFEKFVEAYHNEKGHILKESKFDKIFFKKQVLVEIDRKICFRFECLNHYYLAKYCLSNPSFLDEITTEDKYLNYSDLLNYYSGLSRENIDILKKIESYTKKYINSQDIDNNLFSIDLIKEKLKINKNEINKKLQSQNVLTTEEKDRLTDKKDLSDNYTPTTKTQPKKMHKRLFFLNSLEILGIFLKNSDEISFQDKKNVFCTFLNGSVFLWSQIRTDLLQFLIKLKEKIWVEAIESNQTTKEVKERFDKLFKELCNIIELSMPIIISTFIFDMVGSDKLKKVFEEEYSKSDNNSPEKLLLMMLRCDMKVKDWNKVINDFVKNTKDHPSLVVTCLKCMQYFEFTYFDKDTDKIKEPIANCVIAINGKKKGTKGKIIQQLEQEESRRRFKSNLSKDRLSRNK